MPTLSGFTLTSTLGILTPPNHATVNVSLSGYSLFVVSGARGAFAIYTGTYTLDAHGNVGGEQNGVLAELSGYSFTARGGGRAVGNFPLPTVLSTGTTENYGRLSKTLPVLTLVASGTTDANARAYITFLGPYPHTIRGGGRAAVRLSGYAVLAGGVAGSTGEVSKRLPRATLVAHGYQDAHAEVVGVLPTLSPAPSALVVKKLPVPTFTAIGTTGAATPYEAYSFTFVDTRDGMKYPATRYTDYPFERFVRFGGKYYGVATDGLFELNGATYDGDPIISVVETVPVDSGSREVKRPVSLYIAGEVGADFKVTVRTAEVGSNTYPLRPVDKTGARNYRVLFGKGLRARYLAYRFTNTDGGDFVIDDLTPEVAVLRRTA